MAHACAVLAARTVQRTPFHLRALPAGSVTAPSAGTAGPTSGPALCDTGPTSTPSRDRVLCPAPMRTEAHHDLPDHRHRRRAAPPGTRDGFEGRQTVRAGSAVPPGPRDRRTKARPADDHPGDRRHAPGLAADRDHADPVAGHHHARQRQRRRLGRRLLPGRGPGQVGGGDRERVRSDRPDRPDHPAQGRGPAHPGRDPLRDRHHQPRHPRDPGCLHRRMGRAGHAGGAEGHPAARQHEAGDGPSGRGRAGEAREDHQRGGRVHGSRRARRCLRHDDGAPAGPATEEPAEPGGDRRRQEHHRRLSRTADEHHRGKLGSFLARETAAAAPLPHQVPKARPGLADTTDPALPQLVAETSRGDIPVNGSPLRGSR